MASAAGRIGGRRSGGRRSGGDPGGEPLWRDHRGSPAELAGVLRRPASAGLARSAGSVRTARRPGTSQGRSAANDVPKARPVRGRHRRPRRKPDGRRRPPGRRRRPATSARAEGQVGDGPVGRTAARGQGKRGRSGGHALLGRMGESDPGPVRRRGVAALDVARPVDARDRAVVRDGTPARAQVGRHRTPAGDAGDAGEPVRLNKALSGAGLGSRRAVEELVRAGRVSIGGQVVHDLGRRVDPVSDRVEVDGSRVVLDERRRYWLLNKPTGVVSTAADPAGRPTVVEMVPEQPRVFPVGRLDRDTEGLLLLTNDGPAGLPAHPRQVRDREEVPGRGRPPAGRRPGPPAQGGRARGRLRQADPGQGGGRLRSPPHGRGRPGRGAQPGGAAAAGRGRRPGAPAGAHRGRAGPPDRPGPRRVPAPCGPRRSGASTRQQDYEAIVSIYRHGDL